MEEGGGEIYYAFPEGVLININGYDKYLIVGVCDMVCIPFYLQELIQNS